MAELETKKNPITIACYGNMVGDRNGFMQLNWVLIINEFMIIVKLSESEHLEVKVVISEKIIAQHHKIDGIEMKRMQLIVKHHEDY